MKKKIKKIDRIILAGTIIVLALTVVSFVIALSRQGIPEAESILFSFRSGNVILIDSDIEFKSPENVTAGDKVVIKLARGTYYWKIADSLPEDIIQLILQNEVRLMLKKSSEGYNVINSGNASLNVDIYQKGSFSGNVVLDTSDEERVSKIIYISE